MGISEGRVGTVKMIEIITASLLAFLVGVVLTLCVAQPSVVKREMSKKIIKVFEGVKVNRNTFTANGSMLEDTQGNKVFIPAKEYDNLVERINKILK